MSYTLLDSLSILLEASSADSSMAKRIEADICRRFGITEDAQHSDSRFSNLAHFIRLYAGAQILHPQYMGIGSSEEVVAWFGWNDGPHDEQSPDVPAEQQENADVQNDGEEQDNEVTPHDAPISVQDLADVDSWPQNLKNYVALLSGRYIEGILRICFDECGMKSYLIHREPGLLNSLAEYFAQKTGKSIQVAKSEILRDNPPAWNYNKMRHLARVILPELVLCTLIAPMSNTPNCGKTDIGQNIEYLGVDNVELIQDMTTPVDVKITSNLEIAGKSTPLNYSQLLKLVNKWTYDIQAIDRKSSINRTSGETTYYEPPTIDSDDDSEVIAPQSEGLNATCSNEVTPETITVGHEESTTVQFPTRKLNGWYVVDIDQDQENAKDNQARIRRGVIAFNEPAAPTGKFYFRGGNVYNPSDEAARCTNGVSSWCWTWDGYYNDYRNIGNGDRGFMLISEHALDKDVLDSYVEYRDDSRLGDKYDSSAFGIVIAGPGESRYSIPGLVKYDDDRGICFEARRDVSKSSKAPGTSHPVHYDESLVPGGGNIPGMLKISDFGSDYAPKIILINYSIFSLALIGKWDNSIKLVDSSGHLQTDDLVALMQKWFPVPLEGNTVQQLSGPKKVEHTVDDISVIGDLLNFDMVRNEPDDVLREKVYRWNGTPWRTYHSYQPSVGNYKLIYMVDADTLYRHEHGRSGDMLASEIPALVFLHFPKRKITVPVYSSPKPLGELLPLDYSDDIAPRIEKILDGANDMDKETGETGNDGDSDFDTDESGISWAFPVSSSKKNSRIGFNADGEVFVSGPETEGNPKSIATSRAGNLFPPGSRGSYVTTPEGNYNLWVVYDGADKQHMLVYYIRENRIRKYEVVGEILDAEKMTALLSYDVNGDTRYTLGCLDGERARLQSPNDPYTNYIVLTSGRVVDNIGLTDNAVDDFFVNNDGQDVGLATMIGFNPGNNDSPEDVNVGTIHWYNRHTMEFIGQNYITLDELNRYANHLPIIHPI